MNEHNRTTRQEKEIWSLTYYGVDKIDEIYRKMSVLVDECNFGIDESIEALRGYYSDKRRES